MTNRKLPVVWFTGLSGSGKTTISKMLFQYFLALNFRSTILDGDIIRTGLSKDLGFSQKDRSENIRRVCEVSKILLESGVAPICSFITPLQKDRDFCKEILNECHFIQVYCQCSLTECERRDPKGLYKKARNKEIQEFTGIDSVYEEPLFSDLVLHTEFESENDSLNRLCSLLRDKDIF